MKKQRLLFVCLGNICRSPAAEGVMQKCVDEQGLSDQIFLDSAGTGGWHAGQAADSRMREHASKRAYELTSRARQFKLSDFDEFDLILVMDESNRRDLLSLSSALNHRNKVKRMTDYGQIFNDEEVPDPYYGGKAGFEHVLDLLEDSCAELLKSLVKNSSKS